MTLESHTQTDLFKLRCRLAKQGIPDVAAMDYEIYLRSTLWKNIRDWVQQRDGLSCLICKREKTSSFDEFDVHHRSYDLATLEGKDDVQLVTLCRRCHKKIEHQPNGKRRLSLDEKEIEYQRLMALHRTIVKEGMPLWIQTIKRNEATTHTVTYLGPESYFEFYSLDALMYRFALSFFWEHRDRLRVPLPFGADKLRQPSGANVIDKTTNKSVVRITCSDNCAVLKVSKGCGFSVEPHLLNVIEQAIPWRIQASNLGTDHDKPSAQARL